MKLSQALEGKQVRIVDVDGDVFEGIVLDYIYPEDNEPEGIAAINVEDCLKKPRELIGFNEPDIVSIEIIE